MNFDEDIKRITDEIMQDGTLDKVMREKIEKGFENAIDDAFKWGELKKAIEKRIKEVMVPYIENYDMSKWIIKLDTVLTDIVNNSHLMDNKKILENFKQLMIEPGKDTITLEEILKEYGKFVAENIDTSELEIAYDEDVSYEDVDIYAEIELEEEIDSYYKPSFEYAYLKLTADEDEENMNRTIRLSRWKNDKRKEWDIAYRPDTTITGLRYLDEFDVFLLRMERAGVKISTDITRCEDSVTPEKRPELTYE